MNGGVDLGTLMYAKSYNAETKTIVDDYGATVW